MPTAVASYADFLTAGTQLITDFDLMPVVVALAVVGVAFKLLRGAKAGVR